MTFFLKILNESHGRRLMKVNGASGARFNFLWNGKLRAYTYQPVNQDEVDDLYKTMGRSTSYIFCPVSITVGKLTIVGEPSAITEPVRLEAGDAPNPPLDDKLVEACLHRGVIVTDEDTNETAERLIAAYDKGAADALNSVATSKKPWRPWKSKP